MTKRYSSAMQPGGRWIALAVLAAALIGCSGGDEAGPATSASTPDATTTIPIETAATTTTSAPPATTAAPVTTVDPAVVLAEEVEKDFFEATDRYLEAMQDPTDGAKVAAAVATSVGSNREFVVERLELFRNRGWALRPNHEIPGEVTIEKPAELISPSTDLAQLQVCEVDSWLTVEVGGAIDGGDAIVDPDVVAIRSTFFVHLVDGSWRIEGSNQLGTWNGADSCPAE